MRRGLLPAAGEAHFRAGRAVEGGPFHLEGVGRGVHLDLEGGPAEPTGGPTQGGRPELEATAGFVETIVPRGGAERPDDPGRPATEALVALRFDNPEHHRAVPRVLGERGRRSFGLAKEALPQLDAVLEPGRTVVNRYREGELSHEPLGDCAATPDPPAVARVDAIAAFAHLRLVGLGELELVQVDEVDSDRVEGLQEPTKLGLLFRQDRNLDAPTDPPTGSLLENRTVRPALARQRAPEVVRDMEAEFVEPGPREPGELLGVGLVGVEVDVVLRPELSLQETDIVLDAVDDPERVTPGDPGARRPDGEGLFEHVVIRPDEALVRVDHIELVTLRRDRTVEAAKPAQAGHEQHHLAPLGALGARGGERSPVARGHR